MRLRKTPAADTAGVLNGALHDYPHLRTILAAYIRRLGCSAANSGSNTSTGCTAAHIATRNFSRKHYAVDTRASPDSDDSANAESNDNTELNDTPAKFNDRSTNSDHHQSGWAGYPKCPANKQHRDANSDAARSESDRSCTHSYAAFKSDSSQWHSAMCNSANAGAEQSI